ncbi:MAG: hypothetical protein WAK26_03490 [Terracidiphilus sp.]
MTAGRFLRHTTKAATGKKAKLLVLSKLVCLLLLDPSAAAQQSAMNSPSLVKMEYPQTTSRAVQFKFNNSLVLVTVEMQLRALEENQSSGTY